MALVLRDDAKACEASHKGRDRTSTVVVLRDGQHTSAACYGPVLAMALQRANLELRKADK